MGEIKLKDKAQINDKFREIIKSHEYEKYILSLLNDSKEIFKDITFDYLTSQSNGEPDFLDQHGNKYDVKLAFDTKQGQLLGDQRFDLVKWVKEMMDERAEFSNCIEKRSM